MSSDSHMNFRIGTIRSRGGFTMIELMVVIVIIGILSAAALTKFNISTHRSHEKEADVALAHLYKLQEVHRNEYGEHAVSEEELTRVGWVAPTLTKFEWNGSVDIPQCLTSTGRWNNRGITATGEVENC